MQLGYIGIYQPDHHRANPTGYVFEHVLVAERALGKPLSGKHPVHHVDLNEGNNTNGNLVLCENHAYHKLLHQRQRAFDACGDANARRCVRCKGYENQGDMKIYGADAVHAKCAREHVAACKERKRNRVGEQLDETSAVVGA